MNLPPDVVELRTFFENVKCPGIVGVIDYLTSEQGCECTQIGSGTIDITELASVFHSIGAGELRIGKHGEETPLESLAKVMHSFETISPPKVWLLERLCREWVAIFHLAKTPASPINLAKFR